MLSSAVIEGKRQRQLHVRDLRHVVEEAIRRLPDGEFRLAVTDVPLHYAGLSGFSEPDPGERLFSDYSMPSGNEEVADQYFDEITTIAQIMVEMDVPIGLADWQAGSKLESVEELMRRLNRRAFAISIWDRYAIPWRFDGQNVHVVFSPHDVMGTPIVHTYSVQHFLRALAECTAEQHVAAKRLSKYLSFWKDMGFVVLAAIGMVLWIWVGKWLAW